MANTFITPGKILCGTGALREAAESVRQLGSKAFIVTDAQMRALGNVKRVLDLLDASEISHVVYDEINGEPDDGMVVRGLALFQEMECDFFIALGGGSPLDAMKAIAMLDSYGGTPADYRNQVITRKLKPMVAIPTTAGTGSEATQFTIITDRVTQVKMLLKGPGLMPDIAVIDPEFTVTAPKTVTAATGIDALTHAIEAYTSRKAQPLSDTFAVSACQRIFKNLKTVWEHGEDVEGRIQMSLAALEAGIAFNNSSVTLVHGMSRPIGALFHVPHGTSNAMLLGVCLEYALEGAVERFAHLARACSLTSEQKDDVAAGVLVHEVKALLRDLRIPTAEVFGIDKEQFFASIPRMAEDARASGSPGNTRREPSVETMEELYKRLWERKEGES